MKTINIIPVPIETLLGDTERASYNPAIYRDNILRYAKLGGKFYYSEGTFYVAYKADGILFFNEYSFYSSCLTNNGWRMLTIINDEKAVIMGFGQDGNMAMSKDAKGREYFRKYLAPSNIYAF